MSTLTLITEKELKREINTFFVERKHEQFIAAVRINASGHQGENERQRKNNKHEENIQHFLQKKWTFLKVSR